MDLNVPRKIAARCRHDSASSRKSVGSRKKASEQRFVNSPTVFCINPQVSLTYPHVKSHQRKRLGVSKGNIMLHIFLIFFILIPGNKKRDRN